MRVAVVGGTGVVGRHLTEVLRESGHEPLVLARSTGVDITTGIGLDRALEGVGAVIDVSNRTTTRRGSSVAFFTAGTGQLLDAGRRTGVTHHLALSIVGVDRIDYGYYAGKRVQEQLVLEGPLPGSILRATQFHEFAGQVLARSPGRFPLVPQVRTQPVAAREVAAALAALATGPAVGLAPELAGPQELELVDMAREWLRAHGSDRHVVPFRVPGKAGRLMATGALLPSASGPRGRQSFDQWIASATTTTNSAAK